MPKAFERKVKSQGGAARWRTKSLPGGKYLKIAVTRGEGPRGGKTVAHVKKKKTSEDVERIKAWFGRGELCERGAHKKGCSCGFCANKGKISDYWKKKVDAASKGGKKDEEEQEPKGMTEGLEPLLEKIQGQVKLSKGSTIGSANKAYHNMSSKQAMTPEWKPKAYQKAAAEATNQTGRMAGFKNKGEGESTSGKALAKTRKGESVERIVAALLDD